MKNNIKMITHDGIDFIFIFRDSKIYINWKKIEDASFDILAFCINDFDGNDAFIVIDENVMNVKEDESDFYVIECFGDEERKYLKVKLEKKYMF